MITVSIKGTAEVQRMLDACPKQASRALEQAIDFTAKYIQADVKKEILSVFERPVDYTINSVKITLTKGHNMTASVFIAVPPRMRESYLTPQVEGGSRKLKGFERGLDDEEFVPGSGANLNAYGNIPVATIKKARAGALEKRSGYFRIKDKHGKLLPGVYQRVNTGKGFGRKSTGQRGRTRGRFTSAIHGRGIKPIMIAGRTGHAVTPMLDFYGIAHATADRELVRKFWQTFNRFSNY